MRLPSLTTLIDIGDDIQGQISFKWSSFVDGGDGFLYGTPCICSARCVVKFNPLNKSFTEIGPDLGGDVEKWMCGVLANNSSIYCAPLNAEHILKININDGTVQTELSQKLGPGGGGSSKTNSTVYGGMFER
jgi:hypothetical protein